MCKSHILRASGVGVPPHKLSPVITLFCQCPLSPSPHCHGLLPSSAHHSQAGNVKSMGCFRPWPSSGISASQPASLPQSPISCPLQNHWGHLPVYSSTQEHCKAPCHLELKTPVGWRGSIKDSGSQQDLSGVVSFSLAPDFSLAGL